MDNLDKINIEVVFTCRKGPFGVKKDPPRVRRFTIDKQMGFSEFVNMIAVQFGHSSVPHWGGFKVGLSGLTLTRERWRVSLRKCSIW